MRRLLIAWIALVCGAAAQTTLNLSASPGLAPAGQSVTVTITMTGGGGPAAIQWAMSGVPAGATVTTSVAGKQVQCNGSATVAPTACIFWGTNTTAIPDGQIATISYSQPATAPSEALASPLSATPAGATGITLTPGTASNCDLNKDGTVNGTDVTLAITAILGPPQTPPISSVDLVRILIAAFGGVCLR